MSATFAIATLGCKTNQFESAAMEELLVKAGYRPVSFAEGPSWSSSIPVPSQRPQTPSRAT